ncbi:MAG: SPOR domain-containing protein [Bacillota bacterium]
MEIGLKERVIGAVVLVILGVIIIPFFIKSSPAPDTAATQALSLAPAGGTSVQQVTLPLGAPASGTVVAASAAHAVAAPFPAPATAATPKPAARPIQRPAAAPAAPAGAWLVQAGSYGSEANAGRVVKALQQHGFHASVSRIEKSGKTLFRVRVGPYPERADAEKAAAAVAKAYGGKAEVVPNS